MAHQGPHAVFVAQCRAVFRAMPARSQDRWLAHLAAGVTQTAQEVRDHRVVSTWSVDALADLFDLTPFAVELACHRAR